MKKFYLTASLVAALTATAFAQSKFDAYSSLAIGHYLDAKANPAAQLVAPVDVPFQVKTTARGAEAQAGVIITLAPGASFDIVEAAGLTIESTLGDDMCVATGNLEDIIALEDLDGIKSLSLGGTAELKLDKARTSIGMDMVHAGTDLPQAYKGKGVICGIYDSGVDANHINFFTANYTGGSRVKRVFYYNSDTGGNIKYTTPETIAKFTTDNRNGSHGTHTLGCMTGAHNVASGTAANGRPIGKFAKMPNETSNAVTVSSTQKNPYYGMAPEADIAIGCGSLTHTNIISAVGQIVDYAKSTGQPAVINLSIGSNNGPHDGTDAVPQALARAGKDVIVCIASGNEGEDNISVVKTLTAADRTTKTMLNSTNTAGTGVIDVYGSDKNDYKFTVAVVEKATGNTVYTKQITKNSSCVIATNNYTAAGYIHDANFEKAFTGSYLMISSSDNASTSGRMSVQIQYSLANNRSTNADGSLLVALIAEGNAGQRIDMVHRVASGSVAFASNGVAGWSDGTPDLSVSNLSCGDNVIVVGAYTTRSRWGTIGKAVYSYRDESHLYNDEVAPFTSYGELYNGKKLPHIVAPGAGIISSYSSYYTNGQPETNYPAAYSINDRTYMWEVEQGTSMATPIVAGVVATWLERDPTLTVDKVRDILIRTASIPDGFTAHATNPIQAGAGKINAYEGLKEVIRTGGVSDVAFDSDKDILIRDLGGNTFEVFNAAGNTTVSVYNLAGQPVMTAHDGSDSLSVDLGGLAKGLYILNVNGVRSERIIVR